MKVQCKNIHVTLSLFFCFKRHLLTLAYLTSSAGTITILREGCVPAIKVQHIFERVKTTMV